MKRAVLFLVTLLTAATMYAQGVQTGTIRGTVSDPQGRPIAGATITATSTGLQGSRTSTSSALGFYSLSSLPAGQYQLKIEAPNLAASTQTVAVPLGLTVDRNVVLQPAAVQERVEVVAEAEGRITTPIVGANFKRDTIERLATPRTLQGIAQLAPGLNENAPQNNNQVVINGAFAFDNVFMVNGVDINDNLFAQPQNLFIEDAIDETQVLTSGISAEYGRFTGGVVNAVTKSGGNVLSGSGRINFANPSWTTATPFEISRGTQAASHPDLMQASYEGTFGGPIRKDRLWFFTAGRSAAIESTRTLAQTGIVLPTVDTNRRAEVKLTGRVGVNHRLQGGFVNSPRTQTNTGGAQNLVITPDSEANPETKNWYAHTSYSGVWREQTVLEAQYSQRKWRVTNGGGTSTNLFNSPFLSATQCACLYNAPYFDSNDGEGRNNVQFTGSATTFWGRTGTGSHQTKGGYEFYRSQRMGGGSQSSTNYVFNSDFATTSSGAPMLDTNGHVIPMFVPGISSLDYYPATRGATMNIDTQSLYLQDHWAISRHLAADLGARYEHVAAESTGGIIGVNNHRIVPRLAAAYDVMGDGKHVVHLTYSWYSGRYNEAQIGANSPVANPTQITRNYKGPSGMGITFAPGFDTSNYPVDASTAAKVPTANIFIDPKTKSPVVREFTTSYGVAIGARGYAEGSYIHRRTSDMIEDFQTLANGTTQVAFEGATGGRFTNIIYSNTDLANRVYDAFVLQGQYRITKNWTVNGHYTAQLKNEGNYEGENSSFPGKTSFIGNFPEAFSATRNFPEGTLQSFQRHRVRLWSIYTLPTTRFGTVSVSGLVRGDSALHYSHRTNSSALTGTQVGLIGAAGYPDVPATAGPSNYYVFFGERGAQSFKGFKLLDMSVNYDIPVFKNLRPYVKFDVFNVMNNRDMIAWNVAIRADATSAKDSLGLATLYTNQAAYGTATGNTISLSGLTTNTYPVAFNGALPGGRTFRMAAGFRF